MSASIGPPSQRRPTRHHPHNKVAAGLHRLRLHLLRRAVAITWRRLLRDALRRRTIGLLLFGADLEHRTAIAGELRRILSQTRHDAASIRNLVAAQPPDVGRTGHLLFPSAAILLR